MVKRGEAAGAQLTIAPELWARGFHVPTEAFQRPAHLNLATHTMPPCHTLTTHAEQPGEIHPSAESQRL